LIKTRHQLYCNLRESYVTVSGSRVRYLTAGSGKPLLFIHGWAGSSCDWLRLAPYFTKSKVIIPDLPGFGGSEKIAKSTIRAYARFISEFIKELNIKTFDIIGGSMGGIIALEYTKSNNPKPDRIVLLATPVYFTFPMKQALKAASSILKFPNSKKLVTNKTLSGIVMKTIGVDKEAYDRYALTLMDYGVASSLLGEIARWDLRKNMKDAKEPFLAITGERDIFVPVKRSKVLVGMSSGSEFMRIPAMSHWQYLDHMDNISKRVDKFLGL
jgi:pimeloyl-ACP methyl ester carboxylesterase